MSLSPAMEREITQPRTAQEAFDYVRDFARRYTWLSAVMRRRMANRGKPDCVADWRYYSIEEFLMFNSSLIEGDPMATPMDNAIAGNCFGNAFQIALKNPEYRYTEGWATMQNSVPTHHAWLTGPDGSIHDPTWKSIGISHNLAQLPTIYHGTAISTGALYGWFLEQGSPNILYLGEENNVGVLRQGMAFFDQFDEGHPSDEEVEATIRVIEAHGLWQREEGSTVFVHSQTGQRWCGLSRKFI